MAEIATTVLHNVGNILNSVNVSAELVSSQMRTSKAQGLGKVAQMLNEHINDLSEFLTRDNKGKMLPDYLLKLAEVVTAEQQGIIEELGQLTKGIDHIKTIVAAQQSYAVAVSVVETIPVSELIDDAAHECRGTGAPGGDSGQGHCRLAPAVAGPSPSAADSDEPDQKRQSGVGRRGRSQPVHNVQRRPRGRASTAYHGN